MAPMPSQWLQRVPSPQTLTPRPHQVSLFDWDRFDEDDHMGDSTFQVILHLEWYKSL